MFYGSIRFRISGLIDFASFLRCIEFKVYGLGLRVWGLRSRLRLEEPSLLRKTMLPSMLEKSLMHVLLSLTEMSPDHEAPNP